jgi:putative ABC transport system permease protein
VRVNGEEFTVIGVMPAGFEFPTRGVELWAPLGLISGDLDNRAVHTLLVVGQLQRGVDLEAADEEMNGIAARIQEAYPGEDPGHGTAVVSLHEAVVGDVRATLLILLGAVVFLLLIACTNVADLLLARAVAREQEMAVRSALGANRRRLMRQTLVESLVLALFGGACGVALALWGLDALAALVSAFVPRAETIRIDGAVLAFTVAISLFTGVLFGLWPALRASRADFASALRQRASPSGGRRRSWERQGLATAQVAISLLLLAGAGVMLKSLWRVRVTDPGFEADRLLTLTVSLSGSEYDETEEVVGFYQDLKARLRRLPEVSDASAVNVLPVSGGDSSGELTIEGRPFDPGAAPGASFRRVLPGYFRVAGIPLLQGRGFTERDGRGGEMVVIISREMARRYFPDGDALGRRIKVGPPENEPWLTIVGVAADVHNEGLDLEPGLATYEPHAQRPWRTMNVLVRTAGDPHLLAGPIREEIRALGGDLPIYDIATMRERISRSLAPRRLQAVLLSVFAALAVILAAVGLYGVIAYSVGLRAREFGVRLALGAAPSDIRKLVVRQALAPIGLGATIGLITALLLTRTLVGLLHQVSPTDPAVFAAVLAFLVMVGLCASYVPSRRATRLQPMTVLRDE